MLFGFPDSRAQAQSLAAKLGMQYQDVGLHYFPDGESKVRLPERLDSHVLIFRSLDHPNNKLVELLLASKYLRQVGVARLSLIAPYLCYMRQDIAFTPGEVVSQKVIGQFLGELFDDVITVDPHLHRISRLDEAVRSRNAIALSSSEAFSRYLAQDTRRPILLGPDEEAEQWVGSIAKSCGLAHGVARKTRKGDRDVSIVLPPLDFSGRYVLLIDDVASTGCTLAEAARAVFAKGAASVGVLVTHALFAGNAVQTLREAGVANLGSSDSIAHESNVVSLTATLANAIRLLE
ncbi:MAG: ribose-phosphate diphosphokinase [Pseudomonadota bacterium]